MHKEIYYGGVRFRSRNQFEQLQIARRIKEMGATEMFLKIIRPAIEHILANRERYGRVVILYGARTPEDMLFPKDLQKWSARLDIEVMVTVDRASRSWRGGVGVITTLVGLAPIDPENTLAFVCGPEIMIRYVMMHLRERGLTTDQIYVSMERNMRCAEGRCGHCQFGPTFVCKDGPVYPFSEIQPFFGVREF